VATTVHPILWQDSGTFSSGASSVSFSVGLDHNWYALVYKCTELRKYLLFYFIFQITVVPMIS
jgi:hypothetical protein